MSWAPVFRTSPLSKSEDSLTHLLPAMPTFTQELAGLLLSAFTVSHVPGVVSQWRLKPSAPGSLLLGIPLL